MSDTTMTREFRLAQEAFKLGLDDLEKITINSMKSAFIPYNRRIQLIYDVIKPGYQRARMPPKSRRPRPPSSSRSARRAG
jgi:adenosine deaminase